MLNCLENSNGKGVFLDFTLFDEISELANEVAVREDIKVQILTKN